jgi:hypothetical protein
MAAGEITAEPGASPGRSAATLSELCLPLYDYWPGFCEGALFPLQGGFFGQQVYG